MSTVGEIDRPHTSRLYGLSLVRDWLQSDAFDMLTPDDAFTALESGDHTPREWQAVTIRFGLNGRGIRTLGETGEELGVTRERIRQLEQRYLLRLRARFPSRVEPAAEARATPARQPAGGGIRKDTPR